LNENCFLILLIKIMTTINEMKDALKETLESRGVLSQLRARIRAEIFNALNEDPEDKPKLSMGIFGF